MSIFEISEGDLPIVQTRQALVILDLQNDLLSTGGILLVDKPADFVDKIVALVPQFRRAGNIIWIRTQFETYRPINDGSVSGEQVITDAEVSSTSANGGSAGRPSMPSKKLLELYTNAQRDEESGTKGEEDVPEEPYDNETFLTLEPGKKPRCLIPLSLGSNFTSIVAQQADMAKDVFFTKTHYSAFTSGHLLQTLRGLFATELFICGALTNISVFATAMDAARFGYSITLVKDCLGYRSKERHDEAVRQMVETTGCDITTSEELIEVIKARESAQARPSNSKRPPRGTHDYRSLPQMITNLKLRNDSSKADAGRPSSKGKNTTDVSVKREEARSSHESLQSIPATSDESLTEKSLAPSKKVEGDAKKRVPNKIKTRRRKSGSNDLGPSSDAQKVNSCETLKTAESLISATKVTLTEALTVPDAGADSKPRSSNPADKGPGRTDGELGASVDIADKPTDLPRDGLRVLNSQEEGEDYTICEGDTTIIHNLLPEPEAKGIFERVRDEVRWQRMSHQGGEVPRLVAVQGEIGEDGSIPIYRHPADESPPLLPFTPTVSFIRFEVEKRLGHSINHCLIQFYRNGIDYISEHSDKTLDIVPNTFIANVSLGALRVMTFRTKKPSKIEHTYKTEGNIRRLSCKAPLPHNSLCKVGLKTNMKWLHGIRQDKRRAEENYGPELAYEVGRISLTFRHIGTFLNRDQTKIWGQGAVAKEKKDARLVINGETPEAEKMLCGFGKENHSSDFDWQKVYGEGFDVLHISNTTKLSPLFKWKEGTPELDIPEVPAVQIIDLARTRIQAANGGGTPALQSPIHSQHKPQSLTGNNIDTSVDHITSNASRTTDASSRLEAMSQVHEALRVEQLRKSLQDLQTTHNEKISSVRAELEESESAREQAQTKYQTLLSKINTIKWTLGERVAADRRELAKAKDRIEELEAQNEGLKASTQTLEAEVFKLRKKLEELQSSEERYENKVIPANDRTLEGAETISDSAHSETITLSKDIVRSAPTTILPSSKNRLHIYSGFKTFARRWKKILRPNVPPCYRRIEWTCDCGQELYGDFDNSEPEAVDVLVAELQHTAGSTCNIPDPQPLQSLNGISQSQNVSVGNTPLVTNTQGTPEPPLGPVSTSATESSDPKYLALCINTGEFKKSLAEIEVSGIASDGQLFELMKTKYREIRGFRARFSFLIKPISIRFVHFNLFNLRGGYVGFCEMDKPWSIPPSDVRDYNYAPVPLKPLPPMPPEVFLHYFQYGDSDNVHRSSHWLQRLPKKLKARIIEAPEVPVWGWGIYIVEGPNLPVIFWITMVTTFASILVAILWSSLHEDLQGGTALGSLLIAMPTVIMAAFMFKLTTV